MKDLLTFIGGAATGFLAAAAIQAMIDEDFDFTEIFFDSDDNTETQTFSEAKSETADTNTNVDEELAFQLP